MKKVLIAVVLLATQAVMAMDQIAMSDLLASTSSLGLQRIKGATITSIQVEKLEKIPHFDTNDLVVIEYSPALTKQEIENAEGPGVCIAKIQYSENRKTRSEFGGSFTSVLVNNCFQ